MDALYLSHLPTKVDVFDELLSSIIKEPHNVIVRMEWMDLLEIVFPINFKTGLVKAVEDMILAKQIEGKIVSNHLLLVNPDNEIERCSTIITELQYETDPSIQSDCELLTQYYQSILDKLKWFQSDNDSEVDCLHIKVLSRTLFASRLGNCSIKEIRSVFQQFGFIDKMDYDHSKRRCFIKFRYRKAVELAMKSELKMGEQCILLRYAWPFGTKYLFRTTG
eukprot:NODE_257_length_12663_cov_0.723655.p7 type:complete len:221 gc:universal NODE_257_length_12663_cov_0.723655:6827-7489(+)